MHAKIWGEVERTGMTEKDGEMEREGERGQCGLFHYGESWHCCILSTHGLDYRLCGLLRHCIAQQCSLAHIHTHLQMHTQTSRLNTHKLYTAGRQTICSHTSYRTLNPKSSARAKCTTTKSLRLERESACDGPPVDYRGKRMRCTGNYEYTMPGFLSHSHINT